MLLFKPVNYFMHNAEKHPNMHQKVNKPAEHVLGKPQTDFP